MSTAEWNEEESKHDDQYISVGKEMFKAPEILFRPRLYIDDDEIRGIHCCIYETIMNCHVDWRRDLYGNTVLAGGTTMMKGFDQRLRREMTALTPPTVRMTVVSPPERKYSVWIGGAMFVMKNNIYENELNWITRKEYNEN